MARIALTLDGQLRVVGKADWNQYDLNEGEEAVLVPVSTLWTALTPDAKAALLAEWLKQTVKPFPDTGEDTPADGEIP